MFQTKQSFFVNSSSTKTKGHAVTPRTESEYTKDVDADTVLHATVNVATS
jgi:hypothetical protein